MLHNKYSFAALTMLSICMLYITTAQAAPSQSNAGYYNELEEVPLTNEFLAELITRFGQTILRARNDMENDPLYALSSSKRTVDFGLARGYSGTQEAKHRMGLAAANFPGGPGRRRRSETDV